MVARAPARKQRAFHACAPSLGKVDRQMAPEERFIQPLAQGNAALFEMVCEHHLVHGLHHGAFSGLEDDDE